MKFPLLDVDEKVGNVIYDLSAIVSELTELSVFGGIDEPTGICNPEAYAQIAVMNQALKLIQDSWKQLEPQLEESRTLFAMLPDEDPAMY